MKEKNIYFLSASVPFGDRAAKYPPDAIAVRDAVRALVAAVVKDSLLVFGGHPAITPFVWDAAKTLGAQENVIIYQSKFFADKMPEKTRYFNNIRRTEVACDSKGIPSRRDSLSLMRKEMLSHHKFSAAIFIGGMDGVEDEWKLLGAKAPKYPVASTEGASRILWEKNRDRIEFADLLEKELRYRTLFRVILGKQLYVDTIDREMDQP